jgi:hypothetical protein
MGSSRTRRSRRCGRRGGACVPEQMNHKQRAPKAFLSLVLTSARVFQARLMHKQVCRGHGGHGFVTPARDRRAWASMAAQTLEPAACYWGNGIWLSRVSRETTLVSCSSSPGCCSRRRLIFWGQGATGTHLLSGVGILA